MPASVKTQFATHPVLDVRYKHNGKWRNVKEAYIKQGNRWRQWWPESSELTGDTTDFPDINDSFPRLDLACWDQSNDHIGITRSTGARSYFAYHNSTDGAEVLFEEWSDNRQNTGYGLYGGNMWFPEVLQMLPRPDGQGFYVLNETGLHVYDFVNMDSQVWNLPKENSSILLEHIINKPPRIAGGTPTTAGFTVDGAFNPDLGPIVDDDRGYINSPIGTESYFGRCVDFDIHPDGSKMYIADHRNHSIRVVSLEGTNPVTTLCGVEATGTKGQAYTAPSTPSSTIVEGVGTNASFALGWTSNSHSTIAVHPSGDYLLCTTVGGVIKVFLKDTDGEVAGQVRAFADYGNWSDGVDLKTNFPALSSVEQMRFDPTGRWLYVMSDPTTARGDMSTPNIESDYMPGGTPLPVENPSSPGTFATPVNRSLNVHPNKGWVVFARSSLSSSSSTAYLARIAVVK
jgi:hypothetical protein